MLATETLYTPYSGAVLLENPLLNKDLTFTESEHTAFSLQGLLPRNVKTIEEQTERAWGQFCQFRESISRHIYPGNIQNTNEILLHGLLYSYIKEALPVIYIPAVGETREYFSEIYRRGRGLFISWPNRYQIDEMLQGFSRNDIKVVTMANSEYILGLGDQGIGGMGIPVDRLSLYTAYGGIHLASTLLIVLDVGTNNPQHLEGPLYMGWRHPHISDKQYLELMDVLVHAAQQHWPNILFQFEDLA